MAQLCLIVRRGGAAFALRNLFHGVPLRLPFSSSKLFLTVGFYNWQIVIRSRVNKSHNSRAKLLWFLFPSQLITSVNANYLGCALFLLLYPVQPPPMRYEQMHQFFL